MLSDFQEKPSPISLVVSTKTNAPMLVIKWADEELEEWVEFRSQKTHNLKSICTHNKNKKKK